MFGFLYGSKQQRNVVQLCTSLAQNQSALLVTRSFFQVNGILGGLVGITAGCAVVNVWESLFIGNMKY